MAPTASGTPIWKADITNHNEGPNDPTLLLGRRSPNDRIQPQPDQQYIHRQGWTAQLRSVTPKAMTITKAAGFQASTDVVPSEQPSRLSSGWSYRPRASSPP